jgi:hypothetical protein
MIGGAFNEGQGQFNEADRDLYGKSMVDQKRNPEFARQGAIAGTGADPWAQRNKGMKCMTCIWFVLKQRIGTSNSDINALAQVGRCRRHAPTMNGYPVVYMTDWCGDHRVDENKV